MDNILKRAKLKLAKNELKELPKLVNDYILKKHYNRWTQFEGVCDSPEQLDEIYRIIKEGRRAKGIRLTGLKKDFERKRVKLAIIAEDLKSKEQIQDAISISRLCVSNHIPFIIVPSKYEMSEALGGKPSSIYEPESIIIINPGNARPLLNRIVSDIKKQQISLSYNIDFQSIKSVIVKDAPARLNSLAHKIRQLIKIARLSGKIVTGVGTSNSITSKKAKLVLIANEAKVHIFTPTLCREYGIPFIFIFDNHILSRASGASARAQITSLSVIESGLAAELMDEVVRDIEETHLLWAKSES